jgi:hypothetical protein
MTLPPDQLRRLVRRDVILAGVGSLLAVWSVALIVASRIGLISELTSGRVVVGTAVVLGAVCFWSWASGPREYMRDRLIVLTPVFLIAGPALVGVHDLGGGMVVGVLSGAVGFSAAAILGLSWASRRR